MKSSNYMAAIAGLAITLFCASSKAWVVEENFDDQVVSKRCAIFWPGDGSDSTISNERSASADNSCKMATVTGRTSWGGGTGFPTKLGKGESLWVRFRLFLPNDFDYNVDPGVGGHMKFLRLSVHNDSGTVGRLDWAWSPEGASSAYKLVLERDKCGAECLYHFGDQLAAPKRGVWETYEIYAKLDHVAADDGGMGRVLFWKNGRLIGERTNRPTMWPGSTIVGNVMFFSHFNGGSPKNQHVYFDDLIFTNEVPSAQDNAGNPYIGVGDYIYVAPPKPPTINE